MASMSLRVCGDQTVAAYSKIGLIRALQQLLLTWRGHLLKLRCKKHLVLLAFLVICLMCSDQDKFLSIVTPRYLACVTSFIVLLYSVY